MPLRGVFPGGVILGGAPQDFTQAGNVPAPLSFNYYSEDQIVKPCTNECAMNAHPVQRQLMDSFADFR